MRTCLRRWEIDGHGTYRFFRSVARTVGPAALIHTSDPVGLQ
jgi:hypothetical protein